MDVTLQMTVGRRRVFRSVFVVPDKIVDRRAISLTRIKKCCDIAEGMIRDVRRYVGGMAIGSAPDIEYNVNDNPISEDKVEVEG